MKLNVLSMAVFATSLTFAGQTNAATFVGTGTLVGDIFQDGVLVATYAITTTGTVGFGATTATVGANGIQLKYAGSAGAPPTGDVMAAQMTINLEPGFILSTVTISQTPYINTANTNNGPGSIADYSGTYTNPDDDSDPVNNPIGHIMEVVGYQKPYYSSVLGVGEGPGGVGSDINDHDITTPRGVDGNLRWQQVEKKLPNNKDDWSVTLGSPDLTTSFRAIGPANDSLVAEWVSFNASFTAVPEPSSITLLGAAAAMGLLRRRR